MPNWLRIYLSGLLMGVADVVPGVSGGTMAFILGVYDRLINALSRVDRHSVSMLLKLDIKGLWHYFDLGFLLCLGGGILTSILVFARVITYWLVTYPVFLWSFFFGLILASAVLLVRQSRTFGRYELSALLMGVVFGVSISLFAPIPVEVSNSMVFISGMIAICAMILPGISGSFLLLIMGMYGFILTAVKEFQIDIMAIFAVGALLGLLSFSKVLKWCLSHYQSVSFAFLTGIMLGALVKVWPWKLPQTWVTIGDKRMPVTESLVLPWHSPNFVGSVDLLLPLIFMILGLMSIFIINYIFLPKSQND